MELLGRYLSGNHTDNERLIVEGWIKQSEVNRIVFEEYKQVWEAAATNQKNEAVDVDKAWEDLNRRISVFETASTTGNHQRIFSKRTIYVLARIAAIFIIAFGLYFIFNSVVDKQQPANMVNTITENTQQSIVLSDGSEIALNRASEISYPDVFDANSRQINFKGEAFFNIAHNPDKPFIIKSGELQVEVLGTSFNLCTCPESDEMTLYLESGKVLFSSIDMNDGRVKEQLILTPGQKGIYNKNSGLICKSDFTGQNYLAWKTGIIEFEKTPLHEVFNVLEKTYELQIEADNSFDDLCLTARFENETPDNIFETIQTIFGIDYTIDGQNIQLN
ncbi:MAG: FecR domain-containing protein [Bacteroidetes bacterium]|nr:FecR domain-containing protein [Bacteroidota bacterium]